MALKMSDYSEDENGFVRGEEDMADGGGGEAVAEGETEVMKTGKESDTVSRLQYNQLKEDYERMKHAVKGLREHKRDSEDTIESQVGV